MQIYDLRGEDLIKIGLHNIKMPKSYKYRGLLINEGLTFLERVKNITEKALNNFHALSTTIYKQIVEVRE